MCHVLDIPGFQICQVSADVSVSQGSEYAWIWLNNALWQGSKYTWLTFHMVLNKLLVLNMVRLCICEVVQSAEYAWVNLNIPNNALISLNNGEYNWICQHISEKKKKQKKNRVVKLPEFWVCLVKYIA